MKKDVKDFFCKKSGENWGSKKKTQEINVSKFSYEYLKDKEFGWKPKTADNC